MRDLVRTRIAKKAGAPWPNMSLTFWLRAHDGFTIEADTDMKAVEAARIAAKAVMRSQARPEHIAIDERREGVIAFIDSVTPDGRQALIEDVKFHRIPDSSTA